MQALLFFALALPQDQSEQDPSTFVYREKPDDPPALTRAADDLTARSPGGRILFGEEAKIDPAALVKLIQTRPRELKLEGGDKLKFFDNFEDPATRVQKVSALIRQITT